MIDRVELRKDRLNTEQTVANYLGVSKRTITRFAKGEHSSGRKLKCFSICNNTRRYAYDDVMAFLNNSKQATR
jgi:DNA-binding XRE family transcriptional regulator